LKRPRRRDATVDWRMRKMSQAAPMPMCPMAETCKGMMENPFPAW
jgi:hypothetical protein